MTDPTSKNLEEALPNYDSSSCIASKKNLLSHPKYRPDIDGLRAVAVLAVVAFHAFPNWVRGGFIGVDVFFVISGYLISTIIFENLDKGTFSFAEFYARRIKRIFPALLLVLIACFAFGWFALLADEYKQLGKHIAAGAGFISNFILWNEAGYFDNSSEAKPLLHLWSLGIEEQFYIFWPILLWFAWKREFNLLIVTIFITLISFTLNLEGIDQDMVATFYLPQTRFWELLSGSLLAWFTLKKDEIFEIFKNKFNILYSFIVYGEDQDDEVSTLANVLSFAGLFFLLYGIWRINKETSFPGKWALVPVLSTLLIITAGSKAWVNRVILSNKISVWFGLISFPLYLWHWPLLSFARLIDSEMPSRNIRVLAVILSIVLAWLTYKLLETPIRLNTLLNKLIIVKSLFISMMIIFCIGYITFAMNGFPQRGINNQELKSNEMLSYIYSLRDQDKLYGERSCFKYKESQKVDFFINNNCLDIKNIKNPVVFLIGDSHSASLSLGLRPLLENLQVNFLQVSTGWCEPTSNNLQNKVCVDINNKVIDIIKITPIDLLIVDSNWISASKPPYWLGPDDYNSFLIEKLNQYLAFGVRNILIVGQIPTWDVKDGLPGKISRDFIKKDAPIPERTFDGVSKDSLDIDEIMSNLDYPKNVSYVSLKNILCNSEGCLISVGANIKTDLIVWDYGHLTPSGSKFLSGYLENALHDILNIKRYHLQ